MLGEEWCSGYSIFSVLLQIQCGLFEHDKRGAKSVADSRTFACAGCTHTGQEPWPKFECALADGPVDYAKKSEEEKVLEDTYCFHTRLNVRETRLGTGVAFSRLKRTSEINNIYTTIDLVSQKAFKEGLRKSINKRKFSHWLPLYFGDAQKDKTLDLFRKCISSICAGASDKFDEGMILKVMPKLMLTHILAVVNDKAYSSIKGIRMLLFFHRAFLFLLD